MTILVAGIGFFPRSSTRAGIFSVDHSFCAPSVIIRLESVPVTPAKSKFSKNNAMLVCHVKISLSGGYSMVKLKIQTKKRY